MPLLATFFFFIFAPFLLLPQRTCRLHSSAATAPFHAPARMQSQTLPIVRRSPSACAAPPRRSARALFEHDGTYAPSFVFRQKQHEIVPRHLLQRRAAMPRPTRLHVSPPTPSSPSPPPPSSRAHSCPPPSDAREYVEAGNPCNNLELKAPEAAGSWVRVSAAAAALWLVVVVG